MNIKVEFKNLNEDEVRELLYLKKKNIFYTPEKYKQSFRELLIKIIIAAYILGTILTLVFMFQHFLDKVIYIFSLKDIASIFFEISYFFLTLASAISIITVISMICLIILMRLIVYFTSKQTARIYKESPFYAIFRDKDVSVYNENDEEYLKLNYKLITRVDKFKNTINIFFRSQKLSYSINANYNEELMNAIKENTK
jgi:hypothetical protein